MEDKENVPTSSSEAATEMIAVETLAISEHSKSMQLTDPIFMITAVMGAVMAVVARLDRVRQYPQEMPKKDNNNHYPRLIADLLLDAHIGGSIAVLAMVLIAVFEPMSIQPSHLLAYLCGFIGVGSVPIFRTTTVAIIEKSNDVLKWLNVGKK